VSKQPLRRDGQQWIFDWMIQETGKVMHFQGEGHGGLPRSVRRHAMISKQLGRSAQRMERLADEERAAGHRETALARYYDAAFTYANAQHVVFETNDEKRYLHAGSLRCYDAVRELTPYRIERVEVPWEGGVLAGNLHLCPGEEPRPLVFFVPGCDMTKEQYPHPQLNHALQRGMHLFSFDGPGQGESNLQGLHLGAANYERAASAALDVLVERPEVDPAQIALYGISYGSHWAIRIAAHDRRIRATAAPWGSFCELDHLFEEDSPRFKQLFMYMTGAASEDELDELAAAMTLRPLFPKIDAPLLGACGEYDPRSPIEEVYEVWSTVRAPRELWVFEDQHHRVSLTRPNGHTLPWLMDIHELALDWLRDRLAGIPLAEPDRVAYVPPNGGGPSSVSGPRRRWFD
jgi:pimeloyl-ACP methyl ester carboxylesterase